MAWVRRAALPVEARATGEAILGRGAVSRRLAAILAADVVGCSRLMEADEAGTLAPLSIALDKGRTDKTIGMLAEFASGVEAAPIVAG